MKRIKKLGRTLFLVAVLLMITTQAWADNSSGISGTTLISGPLEFTSGMRNEIFGNESSQWSSISFDGNWITFDSLSTNLNPYQYPDSDTNGAYDIFLFYYLSRQLDNELFKIHRITPNSANGCSQFPIIYRHETPDDTQPESAVDGHYVVYQTEAQNIANDQPGILRKRDIVLAHLVREKLPGETDSEYIQYLNDTLYLDGVCENCAPTYEPPQVYRVSVPYDYNTSKTLPNGASGAGWLCSDTYHQNPVNKFINDFHNPYHPGAGLYVRVPRDASGTPLPYAVEHPYVVFESSATNLLPTAVTGQHIYLRDVDGYQFVNDPADVPNPTTRLLDRNEQGEVANGDATHPVISNDGRFLAFVSKATNLVSGVQTGGYANLYLIDRDADRDGLYDDEGDGYSAGEIKVYLVSRQDATGLAGNGDSFYPAIFTGKDPENAARKIARVAFHSFASNLVTAQADLNGSADVFVFELEIPDSGQPPAPTLKLVSVNSSGQQGNYHSVIPTFSGDGQLVSFVSYATDLVGDDTNFDPDCTYTGIVKDYPPSNPAVTGNCADIFVHRLSSDPVKQYTWRISLTRAGQQGHSDSSLPALSGNGRYAVFTSSADLLHFGLYYSKMQIYQRDQGLPPGSPIIRPSYGRILSSQGMDSQIVFTLQFLPADLTFTPKVLGHITIENTNPETGASFNCPSTDDGCFQILYAKTDCENGVFPPSPVDQYCHITVQLNKPPDHKTRTARVIIPINDDRQNLFIIVQGTALSGFLPLVSMGR